MTSRPGGARTRLGVAGAIVLIGCLAGAQSAAAVPPETVVTASPADSSLINDNTPTFEFTADQISTFVCSVDSAEGTTAVACSSPYTAGPLSDGGHVFRVAATNAMREIDPSPASRSFIVDATPPETLILSGPAEGASINTDAPMFAWAASEPNSTFRCVADAIPLMSCESAFLAGAAAGRHSFSVAATDAAGNTDPTPATRNFTVSLSGALPEIPGCLHDGNVIVGTSGADTRIGTPATDLMFGRAGNDVISGVGGPDCLTGQSGNDRLRGGTGDDVLSGDAGNDRLIGDAGRDKLRGGGGNDSISGGAGRDALVGDAGSDRLTDTNGRDSFSGGTGNDRIDARDTTPFDRRATDAVTCGTGRFDVARVDRRDRVSRDCERVTRR